KERFASGQSFAAVSGVPKGGQQQRNVIVRLPGRHQKLDIDSRKKGGDALSLEILLRCKRQAVASRNQRRALRQQIGHPAIAVGESFRQLFPMVAFLPSK